MEKGASLLFNNRKSKKQIEQFMMRMLNYMMLMLTENSITMIMKSLKNLHFLIRIFN